MNHSLDNADKAEKLKKKLEVVRTRRVFTEMVTYDGVAISSENDVQDGINFFIIDLLAEESAC